MFADASLKGKTVRSFGGLRMTINLGDDLFPIKCEIINISV
jgi:hypothetical protein